MNNLLKVDFILNRKGTSDVLYKKHCDMPNFLQEVVDNEDVSFYYFYKDLALSIESDLIEKLKKIGVCYGHMEKCSFSVRINDEIDFEYEFDNGEICSKQFSEEEEHFFYFFELAEKKLKQKMLDEHKKIVLNKM